MTPTTSKRSAASSLPFFQAQSVAAATTRRALAEPMVSSGEPWAVPLRLRTSTKQMTSPSRQTRSTSPRRVAWLRASTWYP